MKDIIAKINENQEALSALYLKNENADTWTISDKGKSVIEIRIKDNSNNEYYKKTITSK